MIVPCSCGAKLKVEDARLPDGKEARVRCPRCGRLTEVRKTAPVPPESPDAATPLVLVAHESEVVRNMVSGVLLDAGFRVVAAADGNEALRKANESKPRCMVLDVGLPGVYGFELCDRLKGAPETGTIKIVLLSSVYDRRRYKRKPTSLYGADDYIEKHHIADILPGKIRGLIFPEQFAADSLKDGEQLARDLPETASQPHPGLAASPLIPEDMPQTDRSSLPREGEGQPSDEREGAVHASRAIKLEASLFQQEECNIPRLDATDPAAVEQARRFARIIVSDIALYNRETVIEGIRKGSFSELLRDDVEEGRQFYEKRVPAVIRAQKDYYQEAIDNFITEAGKKIVH